MSVFDRIEAIVRHTDTAYLDKHWQWDTDPHQITTELLNEHRAEVLDEAELLPKADVVTWLVKKARELRAERGRERTTQAHAIDVLASKVARGAVRPNNLRMLPPDFFEPGHTYAEADGSTDWKFRCDTVTTHPEDNQRTALGWRFFNGEWDAIAYGEDDWDIHQHVGHTDVTEGGEPQ